MIALSSRPNSRRRVVQMIHALGSSSMEFCGGLSSATSRYYEPVESRGSVHGRIVGSDGQRYWRVTRRDASLERVVVVGNVTHRMSCCLSLKAARQAAVLTQEVYEPQKSDAHDGTELFEEMKHRFLTFKNQQFLKNLDLYKDLAEAQFPKFMVIACADSRVCPSKILGIQPGEAFTIRNVANLVPAFENGPSETNAALEFAVNTLEVPNIFVIGHSRCGGIRALMSMQQEASSNSFTENWVVTARGARKEALARASNLDFDQQCEHCEKESINQSLVRLLGYPWIERKMKERKLRIHGGYYDFINCTFEKWTLVYKGKQHYDIVDHSFWS